MSRRPTHTGVSLFPFLDVLMCTMGALILLLLVTARNIHKDNHKAVRASVASVAAIPEPVTEHPRLDPPKPDDDELLARRRARQALMEERQRSWEEHKLELEKRQQEIANLQSDWERQITSLQAEQKRLAQRINELRARLGAEASAQQSVDQQHAELSALLAEAEKQQRELESSEKVLQKQLLAFDAERDRLLKSIEAQRAQMAHRKPRFEVVAYDGVSGTERRPILVECRADGLTFASERITLSATELSHFNSDVNPLKSGSEALLSYWTRHDLAKGESGGKPYLLLIVRPGGTVGFYVARKLLEKMDHDFGYELVFADEEIQWPDPDPGAVAICEDAIKRAYTEREAMPSLRNRSPLARDAQMVDGSGQFSLPEVENLRATPDASFNRRSYTGFTPPRRDTPTGGTGTSPPPGGSGLGPPPRSTASGIPPRGTGGGSDLKRNSFGEPPVSGNSAEDAYGKGVPQRAQLSEGLPPMGQPGAMSGQPGVAAGQARPSMNQIGVAGGQPSGSSNIVPPSPDDVAQSGPAGIPRGFPQDVTSSPRRDDDLPAPPTPLSANPQRGGASGKFSEDGGDKKRWGESRPNGFIGIEREVKLHLYADRMQLEEGLGVAIPPLAGRPEFQMSMSNLLQQHALSWGRPPEGFFWRPILKVYIHPGGNQHYPRMKELVEHWGLTTTTEQSLD